MDKQEADNPNLCLVPCEITVMTTDESVLTCADVASLAMLCLVKLSIACHKDNFDNS